MSGWVDGWVGDGRMGGHSWVGPSWSFRIQRHAGEQLPSAVAVGQVAAELWLQTPSLSTKQPTQCPEGP